MFFEKYKNRHIYDLAKDRETDAAIEKIVSEYDQEDQDTVRADLEKLAKICREIYSS